MKDMLLPLVIFLILYFFVFYVLRLWARRIRSDAFIVGIRTSQLPVTVIGIAGFLKLFLASLTAYPSTKFLERGLSAIIIFTATIWIVRLIEEVLIYSLKQFAEKSEGQWDDVLIPFVESTLPIISYSTGAILFLQALGFDLSGILATLAGIGVIAGFALPKIFSNFFSGLFLLVDSPFQFGDVVDVSGTKAVVKKIGLRLTTLYVIDQHCNLYMPNSMLQSSTLMNITRPTSHYYYTLKLPVKSDSDPSRVVQLIESVILAHPDTLGNVSQKLEKLESFYGASNAIPAAEQKRDAAKARLLAEREVNEQLFVIEQALGDLSQKISVMEEGGLDSQEIKQIQHEFLEICRRIGLDINPSYTTRKQKLELKE
jgi:MscS family membrane protein